MTTTSLIARIVHEAQGGTRHILRSDLTDRHRRLVLRGLDHDDEWTFALAQGHRFWRLEHISTRHGIASVPRTLGKRLSARLNNLYDQPRVR
ncbi:hypothetical protein [Streptomyces luteireticuli]|uniref:hypothetical protein n=1 Tax=Streptomyces luteireticuli TaxID=173858 RepID=UPI003558F0B3